MSHSPEHVVPLTSAPSELEAGVIIASLAEHGIKAVVSGDAIADFRLGIPADVQILVAAEDLARAQAALREDEDEQDGVDWSQVDVGEPEE